MLSPSQPCRSSGSEVHPCRREVPCHLGTGPASRLATIPPRPPRALSRGTEVARGPGRALGCGERDGREGGSPSRPRRSRDGAVCRSAVGCTPSGISVGPHLPPLWLDEQTCAQPGEARQLAGVGTEPCWEGPAGGRGRVRRLTGELRGALSAPQRSLEPWACMPCADSYGRANATPSGCWEGTPVGAGWSTQGVPPGIYRAQVGCPCASLSLDTCSSPVFHLLNTLLTICRLVVHLNCIHLEFLPRPLDQTQTPRLGIQGPSKPDP